MASGKEVPIPNIGRFAEQSGKIIFITDTNFHFTPAGIPTIRNSKQLEEQNAKLTHKPSYPPPQKADSVNWSMVILIVVLLIVLGGGAFGVYYYMNHKQMPTPPFVSHAVDTPTPAKPSVPAVTDSAHLVSDSSSALPQPAADSIGKSYKMVIGNYPTRERADRRMKNLTIIGNHVEMIEKDTSDFMIYLTVNCKATDTLHFKDSLQRLFGFRGVMILK